MGRPGLCFPFIKGDLDGPHFSFASIDRYWDLASHSFFGFVFFFFLLSSTCLFGAETAPNPELEGVLQKIASRHYRWIALRADVLLFFAKEGDPNAMCGGELLYQRLDERMLLACVDARQRLMFMFRTFDRRFDLYLPARNTVYHGSIFDLEDSPEIESHLKARDLYRALKPLAVDPKRAKVERTNSAITSLDVYGREGKEGALERKLYLTPEGDVRGELFYNSEGRPVTEIQRHDFHEFRDRGSAYDPVLFPKKITIASPETKKGSAIFFTRVQAMDSVDPLDFILRVPPGTKDVFLEEKDPRFRPSKASAENTEAVTSPPREVPVYLAKPREVAAPKTAPARKASQTPEAEKPVSSPAPEPVPAPASEPSPVSAPVTAPATVQDADFAAGNASSARSTLDPSVDASPEMGKQ